METRRGRRVTRTVAIVQARMGSTRAPNKVLADIAGHAMLAHVLQRTARARVDAIVVATTDKPEDDVLSHWVLESGLARVYRGSEHDVLDRFWRAANGAQADVIVRVTADDPLKDPQIIDHALSLLDGDASLDYVSNTLHPTFPEGLDIEVFRFRALDRANTEAKLASEREHVTPYIWKNPETFRVLNFEHAEDLSRWRWTVDKPEDIEFMRKVFSAFPPGNPMPYQAVIDYLRRHPEIAGINSGTARNEGYAKSLQKEQSS
ncbi:MAG TPA: glycosyltransferase family protein [Ramlibacter sp.]|nr:glycosyltransferase family protein [Ramlibacter sp.]